MSFLIECEVGKLLKAAQSILPAVPGRANLPILQHLLMEAGADGSLCLTGTDLEMGIRCRLSAEVKQSGAMTAEAKMLCALLSRLPTSATISLQQCDNFSVKAVCNKSLYALSGLDAAEFPVWQQQSEGNKTVCFALSGADFLNGIEQTAYAVSIDKARAILVGVYLKSEAEILTMVATDTHRLAVKTLPVQASDGEGGIIVPAAYFAAVKGYLEKEVLVSCEFSENTIWTTLPGAQSEMYSRVIAGQFPNYGRVTPTSHESMITFAVKEMQEAVERALLVGADNSNRILFTPSGMFLEITSHNGSGQTAKEEIICAISTSTSASSAFLLRCRQ